MNREQAYAYLKSIWPTVYRIINGAFYFLLSLIKTFFKVAIEEFKGGNNY